MAVPGLGEPFDEAGLMDLPADDDLHGRIVAGRYRVGQKLGGGGMGHVFAAEQLPLGRRVALKLLRSCRHASSDAVRRLIREAKLLSTIEHPAVVRVLDAGCAESGEPFLVLEYLDGMTLKQVLNRFGALPWRWAVRAMRQVLAALAAVHERGLIHRDVKPSNCFCICSSKPLVNEPEIKLIDFGVAKLLEPTADADLTRSGVAVGTPAYWAPEQALALEIDARADVYGAGATLYELVTGRLAHATQPSDRTRDVRLPSVVSPDAGVPPALDDIVLRALAPNPDDRFESASAMLDALTRVLDDKVAQTATLSAVAHVESAGPAGSVQTVFDGPGEQLGRLHDKVRRFWIDGVLSRSHEPGVRAEQLWTLEDEWVAGFGSVLEVAPPLTLPDDCTTAEVFERHGRALLIVGEPGTGKTTELLKVAQRILASQQRPVPVVFTLATWFGSHKSLASWLVQELYSKYQVPETLARRWLEEGAILPLLDGVDEVPKRDREGCVEAINAARDTMQLPGLVVTTRPDEYRVLPTRLRLDTALRLHLLTKDAVAAFFARDPALAPLAHRPDVSELACTPFVLGLLASIGSTLSEMELEATKGDGDQLLRLLDIYTDKALTRAGKKKLPVDQETLLAAIEELGATLKRKNCSILQLDGIQPGWLERPSSVALYALGSRLLAATVFGLGIVLSFGLSPLRPMGFEPTLMFGVRLAAGTALSAGFVNGLQAAYSLARRARAPSDKSTRWLGVLGLSLASGVVNAVLVGTGQHLMVGMMAFEAAAFATPLLVPHRGSGVGDVDIRAVDSIRFSWSYALRAVPLGIGLALGASLFMIGVRDHYALSVVVVYVMALSMVFGGLRGRAVDRSLGPNGAIRRSRYWSTLLAAAGIPLTAFPIGLAYGARFGFYAGLTTAAVLWLWYGGYAVIQHATLRVLLRLEGHTYHSRQLLEAAADRAILHRVGDGFMFIHPLLGAYFAKRFEDRCQTEHRAG